MSLAAFALSACGDDGGHPVGPDAGEPPAIWVSALIGDDHNPGTAERPVRTIGYGITIARQSHGWVHVGQGEYAETLTIVEGVSLLGGHDCASAPCKPERSPAQFVTTIAVPDVHGMAVPADVTRATVIDGFTMVGTGIDAYYEARTVVVDGSPTISNNVIEGPYTSGGTPTQLGPPSIALRLGELADPLIEGNRIVLAMGGETNHYGVHTEFATTRGELRNNRFELVGTMHATAVVAGQTLVVKNAFDQDSSSGGTFVNVLGAATIDRNTANGGIFVIGDGAVITNNVLIGSGIVISGGGLSVTISSNLIDAEKAITVAYQGGGGLIAGRIRNNILLLRGMQRRGISTSGYHGMTVTLEALENNVFWYVDGAADADDALWFDSHGFPPDTILTTIQEVNAKANTLSNVLADPVVVDNHLAPGSPCIDTGTATDAPAVDIDDQARPRGAWFDIGPDEL